MDSTELRDTLLRLPAVSEEQPFGPDIVVYKVLGKMYALSKYESPLSVNLKCDPERAVQLRNQYDAIEPGYHMNKKHWNTVTLDGSISQDKVKELIRHSFDLVVKGMSKKDQAKVKEQSRTPKTEEENWRDEFLRDISQ